MTSTEQQDPCLKFSQVWYDVTLVQASWEAGARGWPKPSFDNIRKLCPASGEKKKISNSFKLTLQTENLLRPTVTYKSSYRR